MVFLSLIFFLLSSELLHASEISAKKLPTLKTVGVLPVLWNGGDLSDDTVIGESKEWIDQYIPKAVRDAGRFRVLNDKLVQDLWGTSEGRMELSEKYEVDGYVSLTANSRGDTIFLVCRLLSPDLKENFLLESETFLLSELRTMTRSKIENRVQSLIYRLLNRLPIDVYVTSVHGRYITITGGLSQNIHPKDKIVLYRTSITSTHPANGAWLAFEKRELGVAVVVDSKRYSSVAKFVKLNYENAVEIGDGAKIDALNTRKKFHRMAEKPLFADAQMDGAIIITQPEHKSKNLKEEDIVEAEKIVPEPKKEYKKPKRIKKERPRKITKKVEPTKPLYPVDEKKEEDSYSGELPDIDLIKDLNIEKVDLDAGIKIWRTSSSVSASSKISPWILNNFRASADSRISDILKARYFAGLELGSTKDGSYNGFLFGGNLYMTHQLDGVSSPVRSFHYGLLADYESIGVSGEKYGGSDILNMGLSFALNGGLLHAATSTSLDWEGRFDYILLGSGKVGVRGNKKNLTNISVMKFQGKVYLVEPAERILEWGGIVSTAVGNYKVKGAKVNKTEFYIGATARHRF